MKEETLRRGLEYNEEIEDSYADSDVSDHDHECNLPALTAP